MQVDDQYEICWNGVNDGRDGDLLQRQLAVPDKRAGESRYHYGAKVAVYALLHDHPALTMAEVVGITGLNQGTVNSVIWLGVNSGQLAARDRPAAEDSRRRIRREYWLTELGQKVSLNGDTQTAA